MSNYKNWLYEKLKHILINDMQLGDSYNIHIFNEQDFVKLKTIRPNDILLIVKDLPSNYVIGGRVQPVQIMIMSEENGLQIAKLLLEHFTQQYNFHVELTSDGFIKHQYGSPTVVNNFLPILNAYRSILYVGATLTIAENMIDIKNMQIDDVSYDDILTTSLNYTMTPDTQPIPTSNFVKSVKKMQSISLVLSISPQNNALTQKITRIMNDNLNGNTDFNIKFTLNSLNFDLTMKLVSINYATAINNMPTIQLGFTL